MSEPHSQKPSALQSLFEWLAMLVLLPLVSLGVLWFWALKWNGVERSQALIPLLIALASSSALLLLATKFQSLLDDSRFGFPRALAAPAVHASFMALLSALSTTAPVGIQRTPDQLFPAAAWLDIRALALSFSGQVVLLGAIGLLRTGLRRARPGGR